MMNRQAILQLVENDPRLSQVMDALEEEVSDSIDTPEELTEAIQLIEFVLQNPDKYEEVLRAAVQDGLLDDGEAPPQFDEAFVLALLATLYSLQGRVGRRGYAKGGLATAARQVAAAGRGGDTMLAHINPREAAVLKAMGGTGTINPHTGLREYKKGGIGKILKIAVPIALAFVPGMQGVAAGLGKALGAGTVFAPIVGNAAIGALTSAVTGGNVLQGALMSGLGSGLGGVVGKTLAPGLSETAQGAIGGGLLGMAGSAAQGKNPLLGLAGGAASGASGGFGLPTPIASGIRTAGNMLASGSSAGEAGVGGVLSGLATRFAPRIGGPAPIEDRSIQSPKDSVLFGMRNSSAGIGSPATTTPSVTGQGFSMSVPSAQNVPMLTGPLPAASTPAAGSDGLFGDIGFGDVLKGGAMLLAANSMSQRPPDVQAAVQSLSPQQQEYFNRPNVVWDWNKLQQDANSANLGLDQYIAQYWPQVSSGMYNKPAMAMGGVLTRLARGSGSGRADTIDAKLSDGEYVIDAETVALLGDGSTDEGAKRLDQMRTEIRRHKGKTLARGKFSPDAKSPLAYLKGAA